MNQGISSNDNMGFVLFHFILLVHFKIFSLVEINLLEDNVHKHCIKQTDKHTETIPIIIIIGWSNLPLLHHHLNHLFTSIECTMEKNQTKPKKI